MRSAHSFFAQLVDYAGLFPPAGLDMPTTVANYADYVQSAQSWMLSRLIVPASRLDEFEAAAAELLPTGEDDMPWMISALVKPLSDVDLASNIDRMAQFNERHSAPGRGLALIDTFETKAATSTEIDDALDQIPEGLTPFFEIDPAPDPRGMIAALAGTSGRAKIRTGGVRPDLIPHSSDALAFIKACADARVAFKATAGLHHPIRADHALAYDADAPHAIMHGFINVFFAAAVLYAGVGDADTAAAIFDETTMGAFHFDDEGVAWRDIRLDDDSLTRARERFCLSFGSCSFTEPVDDLISLSLI